MVLSPVPGVVLPASGRGLNTFLVLAFRTGGLYLPVEG